MQKPTITRGYQKHAVFFTEKSVVRSLILLWSLVGLARTLLHTVLPLQAYLMLSDPQLVSVLYLSASATAVLLSLSLPMLTRYIRRRGVMTLAACCMAVSSILFASQTLPGLLLCLAGFTASVLALDVIFNLYLMDHLPRKQFSFYEPIRAFYSGIAYLIGPVAGVWLLQLNSWAPFATTSFIMMIVLSSFWILRWAEHISVAHSQQNMDYPSRYLHRFLRQPRLRLAYLLAASRSGWWAMFSIYSPILMVKSGFSNITAGFVVSAGFGCLLLAPLWGAAARSYGLRRFLVTAYVAGGVVTICISVFPLFPSVGIAFVLAAALTVSALDGVGNVYFYRAVRPLERPEMTTVFSTYREAGQTIPPGVFAILLRTFDLYAVFAASGLALFLISWYARYIPRGL